MEVEENVPEAHERQTLDPLKLAYLPALQGKQVLEAFKSLKVPMAHFMHVLEETEPTEVLYVPPVQYRQALFPAVLL